MAKAAVGNLDDSLKEIRIRDFSAGLNTMFGPLDLQANETPSCQNVIGFPNRLLYNGGFELNCPLPAGYNADGSWEFYDASGVKHQMVWANGNLYDCASGSYVLIRASVYTAGQQIARIDDFGILYWATATVPLRQYNGSTEQAVANSGGAGTVPPPACTYLALFAGQLIAANPYTNSTHNPGAFMFCNVNDPTTWLGSTINNLGANNPIQWIIVMGISAAGVPPSGSFMIGTSNQVFLYEGPLSSLTQRIVNVPVGANDPNSAVYVPTGDALGAVIWLATDGQFWESNGIASQCISLKILNFVYSIVQNAKVFNPGQTFFACYNERFQYYLVDLGLNQQLAYRWQTNAWFYFQGWPSGAYFNGHDSSGYPVDFVATNLSNVEAAGVYEVGMDATLYGGTPPIVFYQTPYLHGGNQGVMKEFQWVELDTLNNYNTYEVIGTTLPLSDNSQQVSNPLYFQNPAVNAAQVANAGIWNESLWGEALWGGGSSPLLTNSVINKGMLSVTVPVGASRWVPEDTVTTQPLRSGAVSFTISWASAAAISGLPAFDIIGFCTRVLTRGHKNVGNTGYNAQSGVVQAGQDPYG